MVQYLLKVVVIGSSQVGKTSLLMRYTDDKFSENHVSTIGVDFRMKDLDKGGVVAKMQIWDTAGQERFRNIVSLFYRGAEGLIIVFDVTNADSFLKVPTWLEEAEVHNQTGCVKILVGNKIDMPGRVVDKQTAQKFADQVGILYMETSAKMATNVCQVFDYVADVILQKKIELGHPPLVTNSMDQSFVVQSQELSEKGWCNWGTGICYSE